jgi:PIN domain nuclease of toxin-antitoxin system
MRLLLDTHVLLWAAAEPEKIPMSVYDRIALPANDVLFSAVSIWEIAIKLQLGRIESSVIPDDIVAAAEEMGFVELPVTATHAAGVRRLPLYHRDPFDRMLISQAIAEPARLLTVDRVLSRYSELVEVIG